MSDDSSESDSTPRQRKPRRGLSGLNAMALLLAIAALALAGWSSWRLRATLDEAAQARTQANATLAAMQHQLAAVSDQTQAGSHRLGGLEAGLDDLGATTQGLNRRVANLETAYATLSGQQQSGRDTLLLNDAEMLLRTAQQRFELFQDSAGALKAYAQALDVLAQVQNPAYAPVRASVETERNALAAAAPPSRQTALDVLSRLRGEVATLKVASVHAAPATSKPQASGLWLRVRHALGGIVKVSRDDDRSAPIDARFARQALGLDLAQAQEALLAFDDATFRTALQRADAALGAQFDADDAAVKDMHAGIAELLTRRNPGAVPTLGGALAQLQALRAAQAPAPAASSAPAASTPPASHKAAKP